ncbi:MAG: hypothetical protein ACTSPD_10040 [Promethearchaeota archaeon]
MFKFVKVIAQYKNCRAFAPAWYLLIENIEDLFLYFEQTNPELVKTYHHMKTEHGDCSMGRHPDTNHEYAIYCTFFTNNNNRKTVIDDMFHLSDTFCRPKINAILNGEKILINRTTMGFTYYNKKHHSIIEKQKTNQFIFPNEKYTEKDIRIIKWENGTHYYAKIGRIDVFIDGEQKWDTKKEAQEKALKFLKEEITNYE